LATIVKNAEQRAATAAMKQERVRDAALAMREYEAERLAVRANIARLRALRLAKEAGNSHHVKTKQPARRAANLQRAGTQPSR
jgi:hypothetical protein